MDSRSVQMWAGGGKCQGLRVKGLVVVGFRGRTVLKFDVWIWGFLRVVRTYIEVWMYVYISIYLS